MTTPDPRVAGIVAGLPKGAAEACRRMTAEYQFPGIHTFNANGAHSLYWQSRRTPLCDADHLPAGKHRRRAYKLTKLGLAVRTALMAETGAGR